MRLQPNWPPYKAVDANRFADTGGAEFRKGIMGLRWRGGMSEGKRVWWLFLCVCWSVARAQTVESPRTVIRTDVREVVVPVVVLDRQGYHIEGLNVADFQVLEDGKLQRI